MSIANNMEKIGERLLAKGHYQPDVVDYYCCAYTIRDLKEFVGVIKEGILLYKHKIGEDKLKVIKRLISGESLDEVVESIPINRVSLTEVQNEQRRRYLFFRKKDMSGYGNMGGGSWDNAVKIYEGG